LTLKNLRKNVFVITSIIIFLIGAILIIYPTAQNAIYNRHVEHIEENYFTNITNQSIDELYNVLNLYNIELYEQKQHKLVDPFSYSQPNLDLSDYGIYDNCIGFISIEKIGINIPIYLGANKRNMQKGAVHLTETSFPIGGNNTNSVIAAHRGSMNLMFRNIHKLEFGDLVIIKNFKETLLYKVSEITIINPWDIHELLIQDNRDLISLMTCHPFPKDYERYIVFCERVKDD